MTARHADPVPAPRRPATARLEVVRDSARIRLDRDALAAANTTLRAALRAARRDTMVLAAVDVALAVELATGLDGPVRVVLVAAETLILAGLAASRLRHRGAG